MGLAHSRGGVGRLAGALLLPFAASASMGQAAPLELPASPPRSAAKAGVTANAWFDRWQAG